MALYKCKYHYYCCNNYYLLSALCNKDTESQNKKLKLKVGMARSSIVSSSAKTKLPYFSAELKRCRVTATLLLFFLLLLLLLLLLLFVVVLVVIIVSE